ncbi:hypothetical protein ACFX13_039855 [Malus domestica]|uniref:Uncharacterized protein n=1 Tax=Malus domestica TaxID=3750 RepID=A0A498JMR7_MALDO|nr:hypothetical protein DVH24_008869 [Malus domestica]
MKTSIERPRHPGLQPSPHDRGAQPGPPQQGVRGRRVSEAGLGQDPEDARAHELPAVNGVQEDEAAGGVHEVDGRRPPVQPSFGHHASVTMASDRPVPRSVDFRPTCGLAWAGCQSIGSAGANSLGPGLFFRLGAGQKVLQWTCS